MSDALFLEERRRAILDRLKRQGRVAVKDLSQWLQVSAVTIRQDLRALDEAGLLERTYGGAVARVGQPALEEFSFAVRQQKNRPQKDAIAAAAAALIRDGDSIALDSSTTVYALVPYLKEFNKLTVVTNSLMVAQSLLDTPRYQVLLPGGKLRRDAVSVVGQPDSLPRINLNLGFFSGRGLSDGVGLSEVDYDEAVTKQALMGRCVRSILLVDGSKWGLVAPYTIVPPGQIEHIITSLDAPPDLVTRFRELGTSVDTVASSGS